MDDMNDGQKYTPDGIPIIPPLPVRRVAPDGAIAQCGECGLRIMPVMGYACPRSNCPCGFGGPTCLAGSV